MFCNRLRKHALGDECLLRPADTRELVPVTCPRKTLHEGSGHRDLSHNQFTQSILKNKSQGLVPRILTGLNLWD